MTSRAHSSPGSRNADLAKIHIGAVQLGMIDGPDDSAYRDMLWAVARTRSAAELDAHGRARVLQHLRRCGWRATYQRKSRGSAQSRLVRSLWLRLRDAGVLGDASERSLRKWASGQLHGDESDAVAAPIELLTPAQLRQLIESLKAWLARLGIDPD